MKLYIVSDTKSGTDNINGVYYLISEDGELLRSSKSTNRAWAKNDLYNRHKKEYKQKYNEVSITILGQDEMTKEKLINLNKKIISSNN